MTVRRSAARVGAALGVLVVLSACQDRVSTDVHVTGDSTATVHVSAVFTDEAAKEITTDPAARTQLLGVFSDRTGVTPSYQASATRVQVSSTLTYPELNKAGDLLGVSAVTLSGTGSAVTLTLSMDRPSELVAAVTKVTADQPDAAALAQTMLETTQVVVIARFDGGITSVAGPHDSVHHGVVTVTRTARDTTSGTLVVVGDPHAHHRTRDLVGIGGLSLLSGAFWYRRRPRRMADSTSV